MKLLVFDLGHVLIDFEWMAVCYAFSMRCGKPSHEILKAFSVVGSLGYETGKVSTRQFLEALNEILESNLNMVEFTKLWNTSFRENRNMAEYLTLLKKKNRLSMLSNTNENHYDFIQSNFNVERHFSSRVLSYEAGFAKPAIQIYKEVLSLESVRAEDCLFIDDLKANTDAALALGMNVVLYTGLDELKTELTDYGVSI